MLLRWNKPCSLELSAATMLGDPVVVNRDGTNKSQAKSGPARVYSACLESLADFAGVSSSRPKIFH